jgi:hypothetical protein
MSNNKTINSQIKPEAVKPINIEAKAFYEGTQGIAPDNFLNETTAEFDRLKEQTAREFTDSIKKCETDVEVNNNLRQDADRRWIMFCDETGGKKPALLIYLLAVLFSLGAVFAESWFLKPVLQGWNITDGLEQFVVAMIFVFGLGVAAKITVNYFLSAMSEHSVKDWIVVAIFTFLFLGLAIYLGDFRASQMIIQTKLQAAGNTALINSLESGYNTNLILSILGTIALPLTSSIALTYGADGMRYWQQWRSARKDVQKFEKLHEESVKKLEAEVEKRDHMFAEIDETCNSWNEAIKQAHLEGSTVKVRRRPFWEVSFALFGGCLIILFLVFAGCYLFIDESLSSVIVSDTGRFLLYLTPAFGLAAIFSYYILSRWNSPSPEQLYRQRSVVWHSPETNVKADRREPLKLNVQNTITEGLGMPKTNGNSVKAY